MCPPLSPTNKLKDCLKDSPHDLAKYEIKEGEVQWIAKKYVFNWEKGNFISKPLEILHKKVWLFDGFTHAENYSTSSTLQQGPKFM